MPISYAGVSLVVPTPAIAALIEARTSLADIYEFARLNWASPSRLENLALPSVTADRPVKVGTLYWPTGATRWAVGHFLVDDSSLPAIQQVVYPSSNSYAIAPFHMDDGDGVGITTNLWMLPPRPLAQITGLNGYYLLTLVDDRFFWWQQSTGIITVSEGTTTWDDLFTSVGAALGLAITTDAVDADYLDPPNGWQMSYEYTPLVLDALAYNCGQRVIRTLAGTVESLNYVSHQTIFALNVAQNWPAFSGGQYNTNTLLGQTDLPPLFPTSITVVFGRTDSGVLSTTGAVYASVAALSGLGLGSISAVATHTGSKVFHDTGLANYIAGVIQNQTELDTLAARVAVDWYQFTIPVVDLKLAGIRPWISEAVSDGIEWGYDPVMGQAYTHVWNPPWNDLTEGLMHLSSQHTPSGGGTDTDFYQTLQANGAAVTQRPTENYIWSGGASGPLTVADNAGTNATDVTIRDATASHAGVVSLGNQILGTGVKTVEKLAVEKTAGVTTVDDPRLLYAASPVALNSQAGVALQDGVGPGGCNLIAATLNFATTTAYESDFAHDWFSFIGNAGGVGDYCRLSFFAYPGPTQKVLWFISTNTAGILEDSAVYFHVCGHVKAPSGYSTIDHGAGVGVNGGSQVTGGLTFVNGLYISGTTGSGTVTSVGITGPAGVTWTSSPVTTAGILTGTWDNESANTVFAGPTTGAPAAPTFRALTAADFGSTVFYQTIQDGGTPQTQRPVLNFINGDVADNAGSTRTDVTLHYQQIKDGGGTSYTKRANLVFSAVYFTVTDSLSDTAISMPAVPANEALIGPTSGAGTGALSFRTLVAADLASVITTDGQVLIGTTAGNPVAATLTAGTGITITNAPGAITIAAGGTATAVGTWVKFTKIFSDFTVAGTTKTITLDTLATGGVCSAAFAKHTTLFSGGTVATAQLAVGKTGSNNLFITAFDVHQAVAAGAAAGSSGGAGPVYFALTTGQDGIINVTLTTAGGNINTLTQGSVDIWLLLSATL